MESNHRTYGNEPSWCPARAAASRSRTLASVAGIEPALSVGETDVLATIRHRHGELARRARGIRGGNRTRVPRWKDGCIRPLYDTDIRRDRLDSNQHLPVNSRLLFLVSCDPRAPVGRPTGSCRGPRLRSSCAVHYARAKSAMTGGVDVSKPTTSSMPASFGSASLNPVDVIPTTISLVGIPRASRYARRACAGGTSPAQVS